jgi:predicted TIM-barrel fold metal-dependent hydrolase
MNAPVSSGPPAEERVSATVVLDESLKRRGYVKRTLQPVQPAERENRFTIISVDDHILESSATFVRRVPKKFVDSAPRIVNGDEGDAWLIDGEIHPITTAESMISWPRDQRQVGPVKVADMRPGTWDVTARVADMDRDGISASVLFPSLVFGFAGQRLSFVQDGEESLAFVRAYNDWLLEEVVGRYPERFIPCQLPWLRDSVVAAEEIRRNAARGFKAVHFSENPEKLGFLSIHSGHWDPFFQACEETDTVVNLHLGSSSHLIKPSSDSPLDSIHRMLFVNPIMAAFEWVFSEVPVRFPQIKIAVSEGGIDWVPGVISIFDNFEQETLSESWSAKDVTPVEVFLRNFWFAALFDRFGYGALAELCSSHVMIETDYPHPSCRFPDTQQHVENVLAGLSAPFVEQVTFANASALYRHPIPA